MSVNALKSYHATLTGIIYRKRRFVVGTIEVIDMSLLVSPTRAVIPDGGDILIGQSYTFTGRVVIHTKHGVQLKVESFSSYSKKSVTACRSVASLTLLEALASGEIPGIGELTGKRLVEGFGDDLYTMNDPSGLTVMSGIGERKATIILANIQRYLNGINC